MSLFKANYLCILLIALCLSQTNNARKVESYNSIQTNKSQTDRRDMKSGQDRRMQKDDEVVGGKTIPSDLYKGSLTVGMSDDVSQNTTATGLRVMREQEVHNSVADQLVSDNKVDDSNESNRVFNNEKSNSRRSKHCYISHSFSRLSNHLNRHKPVVPPDDLSPVSSYSDNSFNLRENKTLSNNAIAKDTNLQSLPLDGFFRTRTTGGEGSCSGRNCSRNGTNRNSDGIRFTHIGGRNSISSSPDSFKDSESTGPTTASITNTPPTSLSPCGVSSLNDAALQSIAGDESPFEVGLPGRLPLMVGFAGESTSVENTEPCLYSDSPFHSNVVTKKEIKNTDERETRIEEKADEVKAPVIIIKKDEDIAKAETNGSTANGSADFYDGLDVKSMPVVNPFWPIEKDEYLLKYAKGDISEKFWDLALADPNVFQGSWQVDIARSDSISTILARLGFSIVKRNMVASYPSVVKMQVEDPKMDSPTISIVTYLPFGVTKHATVEFNGRLVIQKDNDTGEWKTVPYFVRGRAIQRRENRLGVMYDVRAVFANDPLGDLNGMVMLFQWTFIPKGKVAVTARRWLKKISASL